MTVHLAEETQHLLARIQEIGVAYLDLQFTDVTGIIKTVQIPARQLEAAFKQGIWFDGSALEGFARVAESDMYLRPDAATFAVLPWEQNGQRMGRLICDVYTPTGEPFAGDPRGVLRRALDSAKEMGYRYVVTPELEFFLFRQPVNAAALQTEDKDGYFDVSASQSRSVRRAISDALESMNILVESGHHEVGWGQHELDFAPLEALQMADAIMTARLAVKSIAQEHGFFATFMPKPIARVAGSGMHMHEVLLDEQGANVFADPADDHGLSKIGRGFLAGQLTHARGICAVLAPLVNSYKRLVAGLEAPVYVTWAHLNRSALVRVPRSRPDNPDATRIELRCVDPSCNPYLALAVMLRAGMDGIARGLELPPAAEEELYLFNARRRHLTTLPTSLNEALEAMEQSDLANDTLGLNVFERFIEAKRIEWNEYVLEVSPWELERYLATY
ncbi:MAG TPA: glutamine synthetase family protein [Aggregatilineales bacterium]|nr:glutamine synthetase family protein [Aggregatilineales bacterium]